MSTAELLMAQAQTQYVVADDALAALRRDAQARLDQLGFPGRGTEAWKYTSLFPLEQGHLATRATIATPRPLAALAPLQLVLCNGRLQTPPALPAGLSLARLDGSQAVDAEVISDALQTPFAWLNNATLEDGLLLMVADDTDIELPVEVLLQAHSDAPAHCHTRLRVVLGRNSRLTLIERYSALGPVLTNAVTELVAGANSRLVHYRLQAEAQESLHIGTLVMAPARDAVIESDQLMQGSALRRNDVRAILAEPGAHVALNGIFVGRGSTHTDNQVCLEHRTPHATSEQVYKGMAGDTAKLVFNGRIHIFPGAKGTDAQLSNKNLLLSPGCEVNSKPELVIYNDDVKCSHGTTCGQLDEQALFYLRSRGVDAAEARRMLGLGFVNELLDALPDPAVADWARPWLAAALDETAEA